VKRDGFIKKILVAGFSGIVGITWGVAVLMMNGK
jgi:hypothetical protein